MRAPECAGRGQSISAFDPVPDQGHPRSSSVAVRSLSENILVME